MRQRHFVLILLTLSAMMPCLAEDAVFRRSRIYTLDDNQERKITLTVSGNSLSIEGKAGALNHLILYSTITKMSYEGVRHHRLSQGFGVALASEMVGAIVAATKAEDHWLKIEYGEERTNSTVLLRLDKKEFQGVASVLAARTGKPVDALDAKTDSLDPTVGSKDIDEVVAFPPEKVALALKQAMTRVACRVQKETPSTIQCRRRVGNSTLTGPGGEVIAAEMEARGSGTRVHIVSRKAALRDRNWSTPLYQDITRQLTSTP